MNTQKYIYHATFHMPGFGTWTKEFVATPTEIIGQMADYRDEIAKLRDKQIELGGVIRGMQVPVRLPTKEVS